MSLLIQQRALLQPRRRSPSAAESEARVAARREDGDALSDLTYPGEERLGAQLTLLPVSPQQLLVTWSDGAQAHAVRPERAGGKGDANAGEAMVCLKVYDITGVDFQGDNFNRQWIHKLPNDRQEWVIDLDRPGLVVCVELARHSDARGRETVARSRRVRLPGGPRRQPAASTKWLIRNGGPG